MGAGMEKNKELNELIYEYYKSRILFGIYRYGERLNSIPQICTSFRVARNTVQIALNRLEKDGYIKTGKGKVARVIYQGAEEQFSGERCKIFCFARGWDSGYSIEWESAVFIHMGKGYAEFEIRNPE